MAGQHLIVDAADPMLARADLAIRHMRTGMPLRFETAQGDVRIEGVLVECGSDGRATSCEAVRVPVSG